MPTHLTVEDIIDGDKLPALSATKKGGAPATGTPSGKFLKDDATWATPAGGGDAFPVGSVFIAVVSTNPATLLGYGTWAAFGAGKVLVGLDSADTDFDVVEETGGAKTHTLIEAETPIHTHIQNAHSHILGELRSATTGAEASYIARTADTSSTRGTDKTTNNATAVNQNAGSGGAHNNLQPYIVVYMWKRTA